VTTRTELFLRAYRKTGQVAKAARAAKIDRGAHYKRLRKDAAYRKAFAEAEKDAAQALDDELVRWGFEGLEEPVIYQGQLCYAPEAYEQDPDNPKKVWLKKGAKPLTRRRRSEAIAMFVARGRMPERYRRAELKQVPAEDGTQTWEEFLAVYHVRRTTAQNAAPPPPTE
jgi:hypothetical protein